MNRSETITKIAEALVKAQKGMGNAVKGATNPFFKKNYADLNSIREATLPHLNENGISVIQPTTVIDGVDYVETILLHVSGEYISSLTRIVVDKVNDAQRHGSGLSYARRYALQSIINIGAEDDDGNKAVGHKQPAATQSTKQYEVVATVEPVTAPPQQPSAPPKKKLTDKAYTTALDRIKSGEKEVMWKVLESFEVTETQQQELQKAYSNE